MNKQFVKKMIMAEMLKYEAIKEVLPESIKEKVEKLERKSVEFIKDIAIDIAKESPKRSESKAKKVEVDFS